MTIEPEIKAVSNSSNESTGVQTFKWTYANDARFCIVAMCFGWQTVTPKQIMRHLPEIPRHVLASHLQKVRREISIVNGGLQNTDTPVHINHSAFQKISMHWMSYRKPIDEKRIADFLI